MNDNELREWAVTGRIDGETQEQAMQRLGREIAERLAENKRLSSEISLMKMQSATEALAWSLGQMWIAVGDRMPEAADGEYVLVTNAGVVGLATHRNGWRHAIGRDAWEPTHWMPLPEPPAAAFAVYDCDGSFVAALETLQECEERYGRDSRNRYIPLYRK